MVDLEGGPASPGRGLLLRVLGPEAGARDLDEVGAVGEPVEGGRGQERLAEEVRPLGPIAVAGQQDRGLLIPLVDDVIEVLGPGRAQGFEAEVVEDQEIGTGVPEEALVVSAVGPAAGEVGEHLGGVDEQHVEAATTGLVGERLAEVTLAHPRGAVEQDVLVAFDELAGGEVEDLRLVELGVEAEVEA
jgi:hypothetical protein